MRTRAKRFKINFGAEIQTFEFFYMFEFDRLNSEDNLKYNFVENREKKFYLWIWLRKLRIRKVEVFLQVQGQIKHLWFINIVDFITHDYFISGCIFFFKVELYLSSMPVVISSNLSKLHMQKIPAGHCDRKICKPSNLR